MKKNLVFTLLALVIVSVGCPQSITPTTPVVNSGKVIVQGNLYDDHNSEKSVNPNDVVENFIGRACQMSIEFYPMSTGNVITFELAIEKGQYSGSLLLPIGSYYVHASIKDKNYAMLFYGDNWVEVTKGQSSELSMVFGLTQMFSYNFRVMNLPGYYSEYGTAMIVTNDGQTYTGNFYSVNGRGKDLASGGELAFQFWLPTDFDAVEKGAYLLVNDYDGEPHASTLNFNIFATGYGLFGIDYIEADNVGEVSVDISFVHYSDIG